VAGLDHSPPPFFKRGPAPFALLSLYLATAISLMVLDHRFHYLELLRQAVAVAAQPLQMLAQAPSRVFEHAGDYVTTVDTLQRDNDQLRRRQLDASLSLNRQRQLESENERLRKLLNMKEREQGRGQVAQLLYAARDPFTRRVVVDRGQQHDVEAGLPVVDDLGVVGQVTRVFPLLSEVTLITDKDQAIPVQVVRNGLRSVVFGLGNGQLELRYMPANADVQNGDLLVTSGLDGIFLPGLPVAKVVHIERDTAYSFARIYCAPVAGVENFGELIILNKRASLPPAPPEATRRDDTPVGGGRRRRK
jgi:rod shape-determining protein MreC